MSKKKDERVEEAPQTAPGADAAEAPETKKAPEKAQKKAAEPMSVSRRSLIIGGVGTACLLGFGALRYAGHTPIVRPPGGQDEIHLVDACIRCEKCYEACPNHVIKPAHIEDGLLGMRSPTLDFNNPEKLEIGYCDFCTQANNGHPMCVATCPTGALTLPEGATWQNTIIGVASIDEHQCLAYRDTGCHYCVDACPQNAILYEDNETKEKALRPYVVPELCNGCGACQSVCVSLTTGSIVEGATERAITVKVV